MPYEINIPARVEAELQSLRAYDRATIIDSIERLLKTSPVQAGRLIKALEQPAVSQFRLRVGDFRVYYDVDDEQKRVTLVMVREKGTSTTEEVTQK